MAATTDLERLGSLRLERRLLWALGGARVVFAATDFEDDCDCDNH